MSLAALEAALAAAEASAQPLTLDAAAELLRGLAPPEEEDHTAWIIGRAHALGRVKGLMLLAHTAHHSALFYADTEEHEARAPLLYRFRHLAAHSARAVEVPIEGPPTPAPGAP